VAAARGRLLWGRFAAIMTLALDRQTLRPVGALRDEPPLPFPPTAVAVLSVSQHESTSLAWGEVSPPAAVRRDGTEEAIR
jgi:hypothetical protein